MCFNVSMARESENCNSIINLFLVLKSNNGVYSDTEFKNAKTIQGVPFEKKIFVHFLSNQKL